MKNLVLVLVVAFAFCPMAMANDIAFYVGAPNVDGWYTVAAQTADVATIIAETGHLFKDIQQFDDNQFAEFGAWVDDNTDDGEMDIIWLNGCTPSVLYQFPNVNPDGSRAELWLDGGNMIINVGDWFAYCSWEGGTRQADNAASGANNILDLSGPIAGGAQGVMTVTAAGAEYLPSLNAVAAERPVILSAIVAPWEVAEIFGQNAAGTHADPVVIHNTETDGYLVTINQAVTWINDRGLTCAEFINNWVTNIMGGNPFARSPDPKDGAMRAETWVSLGWKPGDFAASHDVYMGDNFDDVNDGTRESDVFQGNQGLNSLYFVAGFTGYAFPDGLVNGKTYYWRIDEVNDANAASPWKGKVWGFWIPSQKAYLPVPGDGGKFVDSENPVLTWTPGFVAFMHTVYFGDDYDTVATATTGGQQQPFTPFSPGPLEPEKTYFWRVDEFDENQNMHTGNVWSFTTAKIGGGVRGDYYHWNDPTFVGGGGNPGPSQAFTTLMLTRTDPQIDFTFTDSPDPSMNADLFSARWTGEVEAAFTETYTFETRTDDGARLWIDDQLIVDQWIDQGATAASGTIDLVAGNSYSLVMEYYENGGGAVAELRWSSPSTPKQFVPQAALSLPVKASSPSPSNGAAGTTLTPILRWGAGDYAASHEVYFGMDANAVKNATTASPEYIGPRALGDESYDPGKLAWATSYFWRVDEVNNLNPDGPWIGNLWSFTTGDFLVVDDFEAYDIGNNEIWFAWNDGLGAGAQGSPGYVPPNGTGSMIGDDTNLNSYMEETIVHGGNQSMPYWYDNNKLDSNKYSEAKLTLTAPRDWTEEGVAELSLWFRGYPASTGSFVEGPVGTYTMTASGTDITGTSDEFHFAYKTLTGVGSIQARVLSVDNTNDWAKAGVMIRESLDPDSAHAMAFVTPAQGVVFEYRPTVGGANVGAAGQVTGITAPYWVKIGRDISGNFTASSSTNGSAWTIMGTPQNIAMGSTVYIGLALTSHDAALTCQAVFSNVTTTAVSPQWAHQDIGITSNAPEPLYVAVSNSAGAPVVVVHDDPAAATIDTWTEWVIPLQAFEDKGIVLTNVDSIAIGLGTQGNISIPGGSGKMYFDDIRLYRPRVVAEE